MTWRLEFKAFHPDWEGEDQVMRTVDGIISARPYRLEVRSFGTMDYGEPLFGSLRIREGVGSLTTLEHMVFTALCNRGEQYYLQRIYLDGIQAKINGGSTYTFPLWHTWGETVKDIRLEFFTSTDLT